MSFLFQIKRLTINPIDVIIIDRVGLSDQIDPIDATHAQTGLSPNETSMNLSTISPSESQESGLAISPD